MFGLYLQERILEKMENINSFITVKEGFNKFVYKDDRCEILLNNVKKGVLLETHKHEECQFGYCFKGSFEFLVEDSKKIIEEGNSYILNTNIEHGAIFLDEIWALDFKFLAKKSIELDFSQNVFDSKNTFKAEDIMITKYDKFGEFREYENKYNNCFIIHVQPITINMDGKIVEIKGGGITILNNKVNFNIKCAREVVLIFI